jgi:SiaC family regulatory phosphoprotein
MSYSCQATQLTPSISLDEVGGTLRIEGECYPENPTAFFAPVMAAVRGVFSAGRSHKLHVHLHLTYVNSASVVWLHRLLTCFDEFAQRGGATRVVWEYEEDDDSALDLMEDLKMGLCHLDIAEQPLPGF